MFRDIFITAFIIIAHYLLSGNLLQMLSWSKHIKRRTIYKGVLAGTLGTLLILFGVQFSAGAIIFDFRHIPIVMAAAFVNPQATMIATVIIAIGRTVYKFNVMAVEAGVIILLIGIGCALISHYGKGLARKAVFSFIYSTAAMSFWYYFSLSNRDISIPIEELLMLFWVMSLAIGLLSFLILHSQNRLDLQKEQLAEQFAELEVFNKSLMEQNEEIQAQQDDILAYQKEQDKLIYKVQQDNVVIEMKNLELEQRNREIVKQREALKKALKDVEEAKERTVEILESINEAFFTVNADWEFTYINKMCESFMGKSRESLLGKNMWNEFPNLLQADVYSYGQQAMQKREPFSFEEYYGGIDKWLEVRTYPNKDGVTVYFRDITAKKIVEQRMQESHSTLQQLVYEDALTEIPNRRYFNERLDEEWKKAEMQSAPISVLMVDIDYFKLYNDNYGHEEGDRCLKRIAKAVQQAVRSTDCAARYGGEEFIVLLPNAGEADATRAANRILSEVRKLHIPHLYSEVSDIVTTSIGAATIWPERGASPKDMLLEADLALYEAKRNGRNQIAHVSHGT